MLNLASNKSQGDYPRVLQHVGGGAHRRVNNSRGVSNSHSISSSTPYSSYYALPGRGLPTYGVIIENIYVSNHFDGVGIFIVTSCLIYSQGHPCNDSDCLIVKLSDLWHRSNNESEAKVAPCTSSSVQRSHIHVYCNIGLPKLHRST